MVDDEAASGPLDVRSLESIGRRAADHPLVTEWRFRPDSISPRTLELRLDDGQYPDGVDDVRIDARWFVGGDYAVHYRERHGDGDGADAWQCRWDRHPKPTAPREHYHPPPAAGPQAESSPITVDHHLDLCFAVLDWVTARVEQLHE